MHIVKEDQQLMIIKDWNLLAFFIGGLFTIIGLLVMFLPELFSFNLPRWTGLIGLSALCIFFIAKVTTIKLDKTSGKLQFLHSSLLSKSHKVYDLTQIKNIVSIPSIVSHNGNTGLSYHLHFETTDNESVPLNLDESTSVYRWGRSVNPYKYLGDRISHFLNVPFIEKEPPEFKNTFSYLKSTIKTVAPLIKQEMDKQKTVK